MTKGDLISRQAVIDALTKTSGIRGDALKALYDLPSVENKGDLISRQAVLNLKQTFTDNAGYETEYVDVEDIKELPSIPSVENKGEWIEKEVSLDGDIAYECSECGELFCLIDGTPADNLYNFCPNCGADMRGE